MDQLPVIPTPAGQKWREFRIQFLPLVVFSCTIAGIFYIWREHVTPPTLVAHVEPVITYVRAPDDCIITNFLVQPYQSVREGDTIAEMIVIDNRRLSTEVQNLRSELSLIQSQLDAIANRERFAVDFYSLRVDYLRDQRDLRQAEAEFPHAQYNVTLASNLVKNGVLSEFDYQNYLSRFETLKVQIEQLKKNVTEVEGHLDDVQIAENPNAQDGDNETRLLQALKELETRMEGLQLKNSATVLLRSPIDGVVTAIQTRGSEFVKGGDPVVTISATSSERVIGYLKQPLPVQPEVGMPCQIRTRSWKRLQSDALITAVGSQFEVVTNIALLRPDALPEVGLPIVINIPESLKAHLRPGEVVDVTVRER